MRIADLISTIGDHTSLGLAIGEARVDDGAVMTFRWVNSAFFDITGYSAQYVEGRTAGLLAGEGADPLVHARIIRQMQNWEEVHETLRLQHADGSSYWGGMVFRPIFDGDLPLFWVMEIQDVTRQLEVTAQVSDLSLVAQATREMVCIIDNRLNLDWCNRAFTDKTGITLERHRNKDLLRLIAAASVSRESLAALRTRLKSATDGTETLVAECLDGTRFIAEIEVQPITDKLHGHLDGFIVVLRDVSERHSQYNRFKAIFDETSVAIAILTEDRVLSVNRKFAEFAGGEPQQMSEIALSEWPENSLLGSLAQPARNVLASGMNETFEHQIDGIADGLPQHFHSKAFQGYDEMLDRCVAYTVSTDITPIRRAEARLMAALEALDSGITIYDSDGYLVLDTLPDAQFGIHESQRVPRKSTFRGLLEECLAHGQFKDAIGREESFLRERLERHNNPTAPLVIELTDGRVMRVIERKTDHGDIVSLRVDLTEEFRQQDQLERYAAELEASKAQLEGRNRELQDIQRALQHQSLHDALSGLPNRYYLDLELKRRAKNYARSKLPFAVLHIDLDRFKQINDTFGHAAGDFVLRKAAQALRFSVAEDDFVARVGGDEFVVLLRDGRDEAEVGAQAQAIINALSEPVMFEGMECRFGASVGIAMPPENAPQSVIERLLVQADIALYTAKRAGRNRWAIFSLEMQEASDERSILSDALMQALASGELLAFYQPQVRASDGKLIGVEALLRWEHPERGVVDPKAFLKLAEDLGISAQVDMALFQRVVRDDAIWRAAGVDVPKIALNVTGRRLRSSELVEDIQSSGIAPERLMIEILETIFVDEDDKLLSWNIDRLRDLGVSIALDDFGTGHSSIIGLLKLKPQALKIDKSFVDQSLGVREAEVLVRSVIDIGTSLGVEVIAEGIEDQAQAALLRRLGCDTLQGYAFGQPMSPEDIGDLFRQDRPAIGTARR